LADRSTWRALLASVMLYALPSVAEADWYFMPFYGWDFNGTTTLVDLEYVSRSRIKPTFGGTVVLIGNILGVEADYAFVPRFFKNPECGRQPPQPDLCPSLGPVVIDSHVQTFTGGLIVATPVAVTRESLRPYVAAGIGWMDASAEYVAVSELLINRSLVAFNVGGGAIGMFGDRTGVRFDLRRFTNIDRDEPRGTEVESARLTFWRATVSFVLRY
jgi:opacity protein-like surface antigen